MVESVTKYKLSHLTVRMIVVINSAHLILGTFYPPYFQALRRLHFLGGLDIKWLAVSSLLLPLYVWVEAWWMRSAPLERKDILIDAILAVIWFFVWWGSVLYAWTHYAPI